MRSERMCWGCKLWAAGCLGALWLTHTKGKKKGFIYLSRLHNMFEVSHSIIKKLNKWSDFGLFWYFRGSLFELEHFQLNKLKLISWFPVTDFFLATDDAADHVTCPLVLALCSVRLSEFVRRTQHGFIFSLRQPLLHHPLQSRYYTYTHQHSINTLTRMFKESKCIRDVLLIKWTWHMSWD